MKTLSASAKFILLSFLVSSYNEVDEDDNLWGLIASELDYKSRYNDSIFTAPMHPPIYPSVLPDATASVHAEAEFKNTAKLVHTIVVILSMGWLRTPGFAS